MRALDQLRSATGEDGFVGRARSNPRLVVAIAAGALLVFAWIGWAIHVTSDQGARAGIGVLIAWPAMLTALALVSLPFVGLYLLIRWLSTSEDEDEESSDVNEDAEDESEAEASPAG